METGPGDGASILNLPHDTEARTLLAWLGSLMGTKPQLQTGAAGRASPVSLADVTQLR